MSLFAVSVPMNQSLNGSKWVQQADVCDRTEAPSYSFLEAALRCEQSLSTLGQQLMEMVADYLAATQAASTDDSVDDGVQSVETRIFQALVNHVSQGLGLIAVGFAQVEDLTHVENSTHAAARSEYRLRCVAAQASSKTAWKLTSGKCLQLKQGYVIPAAELDSLCQHYPLGFWLLAADSAAQHDSTPMGWLITHPHLDALQYPDDRQPWISLFTQFIQRSVQQTVRALQQVQITYQQSQHCRHLQGQIQELNRVNQLKSEFLANTSHEIRTPLSSMLGFTHLLRQQGFNSTSTRHHEYLSIILSSGQHLLALINDILDLSKIEANQLDLEWEQVNVSDVCKMAILLVREKASDKRLGLQLEIAPEVTTIVADSLRLKQMLFNLLSNAVKFTLQGTVGLRVAPVEDEIHFTIWDTGTGIPKVQQERLFRPYSQIANQATRRGEGTGLGLALTQKLAELHGGRIVVRSELNQGSEFTIVLPCRAKLPQASDDNTEVMPASPLPDPISASLYLHPNSLNQPSLDLPAVELDDSAGSVARSNGLLLVEDNSLNAKLMLTYLSKLGYEVTWARDGKEFWPALERSQPAVILMDINLPDTDGLTLIHQTQADDRYRDIPIIVQTAMAMAGDRDTCLAAGATNYIAKPIDLEALASLISRYVTVC